MLTKKRFFEAAEELDDFEAVRRRKEKERN